MYSKKRRRDLPGKELPPLNKQIFTEQVLEAEPTLYRVAKTILRQDSVCEDAVQEAILKAYEKRETLREEHYFKTWLVRILINECYKYTRRLRPQVSYEEYFAETAEEHSDYSALYAAIQDLPPRIRLVIVLYYTEGYTVEEIRQILKIPGGTVKSRLSKGRKLLKEALQEQEGFA